jgi:hypothetical protein
LTVWFAAENRELSTGRINEAEILILELIHRTSPTTQDLFVE